MNESNPENSGAAAVSQSMGGEPPYPVQVDAVYPAQSSRGLALLGILFLLKELLLLPHLIVLYFVGIATFFVIFIGYFAVLFTGRYPRGLFDFVLGYLRWNTRIYAWLAGVTDHYPPFSLH